MADIATAVLSGVGVALQAVRQFLSNPSITYTDPVTGISQTVTIQATAFKELLSNQASKLLLVDVARGKSFLNDNIAPMPRIWQIEGFLFPLIPTTPLVDQIALESIKETLRTASDSRQLVQFKPVATSIASQFVDAFQSLLSQSVTGTIPVVILDIEMALDPLVVNKAPIKITLQKMDTLTAVLAAGNGLVANPDGNINNPAASSSSNALGNATNAVTTTGGF